MDSATKKNPSKSLTNKPKAILKDFFVTVLLTQESDQIPKTMIRIKHTNFEHPKYICNVEILQFSLSMIEMELA
jgi:hypothetical protein